MIVDHAGIPGIVPVRRYCTGHGLLIHGQIRHHQIIALDDIGILAGIHDQTVERHIRIGHSLLIPFLGTSLGSALVFLLKKQLSARVQKMLTGFAAGVMVAASFWSLLQPALENSAHMGALAFLPAAVGFLIGMGSGVNVTVARYLGAGRHRDVSETVHTSALLLLITGGLLLALGVAFTPALLRLLGTKDVLLAGAIRYLRIYLFGMPALAVFIMTMCAQFFSSRYISSIFMCAS